MAGLDAPRVMPFDAAPAASATRLDQFLAGVERRAFRMAELALGHREDALDAVQEAMIKLMAYRERPSDEWTPLFWSILRRQVADRHRRDTVRRRVMAVLGRGVEPAAMIRSTPARASCSTGPAHGSTKTRPTGCVARASARCRRTHGRAWITAWYRRGPSPPRRWRWGWPGGCRSALGPRRRPAR